MAVSAEEIRIVDTRDEPLQGAMMVIGFPTHGLVGSVAASYLVHALDMTSVAYMTSDHFPPTVIMEEGVVSAPVRFYVSKLVCGVDRSCRAARRRDLRHPTARRAPSGPFAPTARLGGGERGPIARGRRGPARGRAGPR